MSDFDQARYNERLKMGGAIVFALFILPIAILSLVGGVPGVMRSLQSYGWKETSGVVVSHDLDFDKRRASGDVVVQYELDGETRETVQHIYDAYPFGNARKQYAATLKRMAPEQTLPVYVSTGGETRVTHWPADYEVEGLVRGLSFLLFAGYYLSIARQKYQKLKMNPA